MDGVIVNGVRRDIPRQVCSRCVQDSSVPGIRFDAQGVCNFCQMHDKLEGMFPNDARGERILERFMGRLRERGRGKEYDCITGISGGRDSTYTLHWLVKTWGLRPLAVHFNDGFDNPVAGENMVKATQALGVELRTITSDWRESKELKIDFLKASTPDLNLGTDIGIASSLYGVATKEHVKTVIIGQSFRTEGIKPLSWTFFDGTYLRSVHRQFGSVPLKPWTPDAPGFHLCPRHLLYYSVIRGIRTILPMYWHNYVRADAEKVIKDDLGWVYPGAHYYDDLYHSLIKYVHRVKFNIDYNMNSDSALVRSGQMDRLEALERAGGVYQIEDPKVIDLCVNRLGLSRDEFESFMTLPPKTFRDYPTSHKLIRLGRAPIKLMTMMHMLPAVTYDKYFNFGE